MFLAYVDDYGHTGSDLANPDQPIYMLFAVIVTEDAWAILEPSLWNIITEIADKTGQDLEGFELHAKDFFNGRNRIYRALSVEEKADYCGRIVRLLKILNCTCLATYVVKERVQDLIERYAATKATGTTQLSDGTLAALQPHPLAFSRLIDEMHALCERESMNSVIIMDHQEEYAESRQMHSHMLYRSSLPIDTHRILDMPFDGDGRYNILLQISDLLGYIYGRYLQHITVGRKIFPAFLPIVDAMTPILTAIDAFHDLKADDRSIALAMLSEYTMRFDKRAFPASFRVAQLTALLSQQAPDFEAEEQKKGQGALE